MPSRLSTARPPSLPIDPRRLRRYDAVHRRREQRKLEAIRTQRPRDVDVIGVTRATRGDDGDIIEAVGAARLLASADLNFHDGILGWGADDEPVREPPTLAVRRVVMETWFRQTPHDAGTCARPRPRRRAGGGACGRAVRRRAPRRARSTRCSALSARPGIGPPAARSAATADRAEEIDRHAADVAAGLAQDTADAHDTAFADLAELDMKLCSTCSRRCASRAAPPSRRSWGRPSPRRRPQPHPERARRPARPRRDGRGRRQPAARPPSATRSASSARPSPARAATTPRQHLRRLRRPDQDLLHDHVEARRSSVWLANNPGNSDELGGMGLRHR